MTPRRQNIIRNAAKHRQLDVAVILENVHDPHNLSAVLRSCDAAGIADVHILYTDPKLQKKKNIHVGKRSSAGSRKWMNVIRHNDATTCFVEVKKKYGQVYGTLIGSQSKSLFSLNLTQPIALLFGNEHTGISSEAAAHCDGQFHIPQFGFGQSLNISVACAVSVYEVARQRLEAKMYHRKKTHKLTIKANEMLTEKFESGKNGRDMTIRTSDSQG